MNFRDYAKYYDCFYADKNYENECNYLEKIFQKHSTKKIKTILDLGCGTGSHDFILEKKGYEVTGIDSSGRMLEAARRKKAELKSWVNFYQGDIRRCNLRKKFDAVISMFAVMGYQVRDQDLRAALKTIKRHLVSGGIFVFDSWYGPAVLRDLPCRKVKRIENAAVWAVRTADPLVCLKGNYVDVKYKVHVMPKSGGAVDQFCEIHRMRYFFLPQMQEFFKAVGLRMIKAYGWMTHDKPCACTWSVCFIGGRL